MEQVQNTVIGNEKRLILCAGLLAWTMILFCLSGEGLAAPSVSVTGCDMHWSDAVVLDLSDFASQGKILETVDPNFKGDGKQAFTGIPLTRLLKMAGLENTHGLTVIGSDQYVGYLTPERVAQGMLAWEMGGKPIAGLKGGPLKIMFPEQAGVHASCFTWYVTALVQDRPAGEALTIVTSGGKTQYPFSDLALVSAPLPSGRVSIAQGCRNEFAEAASNKPARSVNLRRLTGDLSRATSVELVPYYGPVIRLRPEALAFDAQVIVSCGAKNLHPALGGPYSIVFPVEEHHELKSMVPESGAFFFLKAVIVR